MSVKSNIQKQIDGFRLEQIFTVDQLKFSSKDALSVSKALSILRKEGYIKRLSRRLYYKPRKSSVTGNQISMNTGDLVYHFTKNTNGYLTGADIYRQMGLTTQMSFVYTIASFEKRHKIAPQNCKLQFVKAYCEPTSSNIPLLRILDAIRDLKHIPDCSEDEAIKKLSAKISKLTPSEIKKLVECAKPYPPRVRAIIGAILAYLQFSKEAGNLKKTINPLSKFNVDISETMLPTKHLFNIV